MLLQESLTSIDRYCCKSCCEADRSILLMNRISERCHRDLKYSNAVDEDAPSSAAVNTAANRVVDG